VRLAASLWQAPKVARIRVEVWLNSSSDRIAADTAKDSIEKKALNDQKIDAAFSILFKWIKHA
jgi:hypothetical protein